MRKFYFYLVWFLSLVTECITNRFPRTLLPRFVGWILVSSWASANPKDFWMVCAAPRVRGTQQENFCVRIYLSDVFRGRCDVLRAIERRWRSPKVPRKLSKLDLWNASTSAWWITLTLLSIIVVLLLRSGKLEQIDWMEISCLGAKKSRGANGGGKKQKTAPVQKNGKAKPQEVVVEITYDSDSFENHVIDLRGLYHLHILFLHLEGICSGPWNDLLLVPFWWFFSQISQILSFRGHALYYFFHPYHLSSSCWWYHP